MFPFLRVSQLNSPLCSLEMPSKPMARAVAGLGTYRAIPLATTSQRRNWPTCIKRKLRSCSLRALWQTIPPCTLSPSCSQVCASSRLYRRLHLHCLTIVHLLIYIRRVSHILGRRKSCFNDSRHPEQRCAQAHFSHMRSGTFGVYA